MGEVLLYIIFFVIVTVAIILVYSILKKSFAKNRTIYLNNLEDLSTHYYRYLLYFWGVGILIPFSELYVDLFSVRAKSELIFNLLTGAVCLAIAYLSGYYILIRRNLHKLFLLFFSIYNLIILYKIATYKEIDYLTLTEFTLMNMISYYVFYKLKYFYFYIGACSAVLLTLVLSNTLSSKEFIIYFNSSFIAFTINFVIHHVDLNIKENLFFAYNYFNKGNQFIIGVNQDGFVTFASKNIDALLGLNSNAFIGKKWESEVKDQLGFEKKGDNSTLNLKLPDGSLKIIEWQEDTINHDLVIKIGRDITAVKRSETQITLSNNRLKSLISNIGDMVFVLNLDKVFTDYYQSENEADLIASPSFFLGKKINEIGFPDEALHIITNAIEETIKKNKKTYVEYNLHSDKGTLWFGVVVSPLCDDAGQIKEVICIARNITTSKNDELELKKIKEVLEQTSQVAKVGAWEIDVQNQKVFFSDINKSTLEAPPDFELNLDSALAFFKEGKDRELAFDSFTLCFKKGISFDIEVRIVTFKNNERWVRALGQAEYENGRCKRLYGTFQDINDQVNLVQLIKDKELQYRSLLSNISSVTFRCANDARWTMIFISDAIEQLSGYPAEDFILNSKRSYYDLVFPEDRNLVDDTANDNAQEYDIEYRIVNKSNEIVWIIEKGRRYYDEIEKRMMIDGIISNITERKHAEIALVKSYEELKNTQSQLISTQLEQEKFVSLVKYSGAMIAMTDFNGKIIFLNEKAKQALGYNNLHENLITRDFFTEKSKFLLNSTILPIVYEKGIWQGEQELINLNNNEIIITDSTIFIIRDPQNKRPVAIATIQIDITERKKAEAKLIENQKELLYKSELLAVVAKSTERLLISTNIEETLSEIFDLIGDTIGADRIYYFENDIPKNLTSQKTEWVREGIAPQIDNPVLQNLPLENYALITDELLQNKVFKKIISEIEDPEVLELLSSQSILSIILFPITIKDKLFGFIGFDDCTNEQIWSDDKINILFSLSTNVANAIERINNELIIRESEANFRQLNETLEDVFLLFDVAQNRYIYVSPSCKKVLGIDQSYFYHPNTFINDIFFEDDQPTKEQVLEQIYLNNSFELEYRIKALDGSQKWILMKSFGIRNEENELLRISAICTDITERKNIQSEIKQLSLVAEKIINGVLIADTKGRVLWANQSFLDMMEIDLPNLLGKRPTDLFNPKFKDTNIEAEILNGNNFNIELEIETFKKTKKWVEIINTSIKDDRGSFVQQIEVVIDITERKKVESLLIESEERYRFIAESTSDGIFVIENTRIVYTSPSFQKIFGYTFEESYKQSEGNLTDYIHPEDVENFRKNINYHTGLKHDNFVLQYRSLHKNANYIWREDTITAIYDGDSIFRFITVVRNISERVKVEKELVEERRLLRAIIDNIPVNVYVKDNSFKKVLSNKTDVQFAGFQDEKSVLGKTDFEIFNKDTAQISYEQDFQVIQSKESIIGLETQLVKNDGTESWLLVSKIPLLNEKEEVTGLVGVSVDITERRKSQQLLLESERTLSSILNSLDEVVWAISLPDSKLVLISNSFDKVFGKSSKIWKRKFLLWKEAILPEDKWIGERIEKEINTQGQAYGIFRIKDSHGDIKWLENTVKVIRNEQDEPVMIIGTSTDITEKKNAEDALRSAQELAEEANRLKAELELRALQMQMNPHFIFNALNSIQSYILNQDTLTANLYLTKFSRLIRLFLESSRSKFIPLSEEINLLTLYIELEKIRFDNKFEFEILFEGHVNKNIEIPTMILQPFIENAINHGLRYKQLKGLLTIRFHKEQNYLICTIEDDGVGRKNSEIIKDKPIEGYKSQGLKITAERLITYNKINDANIVFSVRDRIEHPINPDDEVGTVIEIRFPEI